MMIFGSQPRLYMFIKSLTFMFRDKYAWNQTFEDVDIIVPTTIASTKMVSNKSLNLKLLTHARPDSSVARRLLNSYVVQNDVTLTNHRETKYILQVRVEIKTRSLRVQIGDEIIINDDLQHPVKSDDSTWSLEKGKSLMISLTKATEIWWSKLTNKEGL